MEAQEIAGSQVLEREKTKSSGIQPDSLRTRAANFARDLGSKIFRRPQTNESTVITPPQPDFNQPAGINEIAQPAVSVEPQIPVVKSVKQPRIRLERPAPKLIPVSKKRKIQAQLTQKTETVAQPQEIIPETQSLQLKPEDLFWLSRTMDIVISRRTIPGTRESYFFGEAIYSKSGKLEKAHQDLNEKGLSITTKLLNAHVDNLALGRSDPLIRPVDGVRATSKIYYISNREGDIRVYVMKLKTATGETAIVKVADCHKTRQMEVLRELTDSSKKELKQRGKLN